MVHVYQNHPTFLALRDPDHFKGKCGYCEFRMICGGSRRRAYAVTGDPLETEPDCAYERRRRNRRRSEGRGTHSDAKGCRSRRKGGIDFAAQEPAMSCSAAFGTSQLAK